MSHIYSESYDEMPQFLASNVGKRLVTVQVPQSMGVQDGNRLMVKAGTIFPVNDATAKGVLYTPVDVTHGDHAGSLMVAGYVYGNRLPVAPADTAKTALAANGLHFEDAVGMVR